MTFLPVARADEPEVTSRRGFGCAIERTSRENLCEAWVYHSGVSTPVRRRVARIGAAAWIFILLAIGGVQYFRGAWTDGLIFTVVAAVLVGDATGLLPSTESGRGLPRPTLVIAAVVLLSAVLVLAPRHGILAGTTLVVVGVAAVVFAWPDRPRGERDAWTRAVVRAAIAWSVAGVATCLWELSRYIPGTLTPGGRVAYPALSDLLDPFVDIPMGRVLFVIGWVLTGAFLLRRVVSR